MIETNVLPNNFTTLLVRNKIATAKIALQGAHLYHYQRHDEAPLLYLSKTSHFETGKPIRGGIPVCWPWFGKHKKNPLFPQHGFARTTLWECIETKDTEYSTVITLQLKEEQKNIPLWPYKAKLQLKITIADTLRLQLFTTNIDTKPFTISSALHSYFAISAIKNVLIKGLNNVIFVDTLTMTSEQSEDNISITEETDRVYQGVSQPVEIHDSKRVIHIDNSGSKSVVLWNPWEKKNTTLSDMNNGDYKQMLCIEAANAFDDTRLLAPGETHILGTSIS